jgi:hypothetical protein
MSDEVRIHIGYVAVDAQGCRELRRHLASWEQQRLATVSDAAADLPDDAPGAQQAAQADLLLLLLSPDLLAEAPTLIAQAQARCSGSGGRPRLLFLRWRSVGPLPAQLAGLTMLPGGGQPIADDADRGLGFARVERELKQILYAVRPLPRRPAALPPIAALTNENLPTTRAGAGLSLAAAAAPALAGLPQQKWALLVGINRFVDSRAYPPLRYCVSDVKVLGETLRQQGYQVCLLHDEQDDPQLRPYLRNVEARLATLCDRAKAEDLLLVHVASHGFCQRQTQLLAMLDTRADRAESTALAVSSLCDRIRQSAARRRVLVLDACQAGAVIHRGSDDDEFIEQSFARAEGFVRIAASTSDQLAQEWAAQKMGVFSYYLNQALLGAARARNQFGLVTAQSAANYLLFELRRWTRQHLGREQEPTISYEGLGEMVLADYRDAPPKESA